MYLQIVGLVVVAGALWVMRKSWSATALRGDYLEMNAARMASLHDASARAIREQE